MKILYLNPLVSNDPNNLYGAMLHAYEFIKAARELGHDIDVYPSINSGDFSKYVKYATHELSTIFSQREFLIKYYSGVIQDLVLRKAFNSLVRNCDCIVARTAIMTFHTLEMLKNSDYPYILELNAFLHEEKSNDISSADLEKLKKKEINIIKHANALTVVSPQLMQAVSCYYVDKRKVYFNPNGVDSDVFHPRVTHYPIKEKFRITADFTVGFLGNVKPAYDLLTLLKAIRILRAKNKSVHLILAGKGTESEGIKGTVRALGISKYVTQVGFIERNVAPSVMASFDVAVAPLHRNYPFVSKPDDVNRVLTINKPDGEMSLPVFGSLKEFEYMAMGKPIIATNPGQASQSFINTKTGILVQAGESEQIANAVSYLMDNPDDAVSMGQAARKEVLEKYTWKHNAERVFNVCRTVMSEKTSC